MRARKIALTVRTRIRGPQARIPILWQSQLTLAALVLSGCATPPIAIGVPRVVPRVIIAPYATRDECVHVTAGERLDYRYTSSAAVNFDIRYHEAASILMPIVTPGATAGSGIYVPLFANDYCLTWEAGPAGAILQYRVVLRRPVE